MNYLKRDELISSVGDSIKIWHKLLNNSEINELLNNLEIFINNHDYEIDDNFIMDGRRSHLKESVIELSTSDRKDILTALFMFWEFVNNEYHVISPSVIQELKLSRDVLENKCNKYTESNIVCLQEKNEIIEMINTIKNNCII